MGREPRSGICPKKSRRDRLIALAQTQPAWAWSFQDETWWSRVSPPVTSAWATQGRPLRLVQQSVPAGEAKALACYGLLLPARNNLPDQPGEIWLRFVDGRPVSAVTIDFLDWCCARLEARGTRVWVMIWDNAAWHLSRAVRTWVHEHNRTVKHSGQGVRILACRLPVKSPWLNPIEVYWHHGKRQTVEPGRLLTSNELEQRVCDYYNCPTEPHLVIPEKVA